ncbi:MAG: CSLREA domain-containing protein [Acidimicrobiia bacterium]
MRRTVKLGLIGGTSLSLLLAVPSLAQERDRGRPRGGPVLMVGTTDDTLDAAPGDGRCADASGRCSLRAAVQEANADPARTTITLAQATYVLTIAGAGEDTGLTGDLDVTTPVELSAVGATVDANGLDRALHVLAGGSLDVRGLRVTGGTTSASGGGYANAGTLNLDGGAVSGNTASGPGASGGGILNSGILRVVGTEISGNSATRAGGGIEANAGQTTLTRATLQANTTGPTPGNGGGLHLTGTGTVAVSGSRVTGNTASAEGGGLWNSSTGTMTVDDTTIDGNTASGPGADQGGGGLFNDGGTTSGGSLTVTRSRVTGNTADGAAGSGGGILNDEGTLTVGQTLLSSNRAPRAGGGIESNVGTNTLDRVELVGNATGAAPGNGGGMHITGAGNATITRSNVNANTAAKEGGGLWNGAGTMTVEASRITANTASGTVADDGGGGVFNNLGTLVITRTDIVGNTADGATGGSGGGIFNNNGSLSVSGSAISANQARRAGGGIESLAGTTELDNVRLVDNVTGPTPGNGGGLHLTGAGTVTVTDSRVTGNSATNEGGGLWNSSTGTMTVTTTTVAGNSAPTGPNVFTQPGGVLTVDGAPVPPGDNDLSFGGTGFGGLLDLLRRLGLDLGGLIP